MSAPEISVVVPTKDRTESLEHLLHALERQTLDPERFEVLVVDDGPSSETQQVVEAAATATPMRVRYLPNERRHGPAAARNVGWRSAHSSVVAFTDDDTVPDKRWLEEGLRVFGDPDVAGAMGRVVVPLPLRPSDSERDTGQLEDADFVTANAFYRKRALEEVGGFDERYRMAWREDADLYFSLVERGERLERVPWAIVVHPAHPARWGASISRQRKAEYNALLYRKHPQLYRDTIGRSPRWYYTTIAALIATPLAIVLGRRRLAAVAAGAWAGMTLGFAVERLRGASRSPSHVAEMFVTSAAIPPVSVYHRLKGSLKFRSRYW